MPTTRNASKTAEQPLPARLARLDADRLRRYRENLAFYEGRQWQGRPRHGERRLTFNYAKAFAKTPPPAFAPARLSAPCARSNRSTASPSWTTRRSSTAPSWATPPTR